MKKHLVFYDGNCPLCNQVVRFLLKHDKDQRFLYAPLQGKTATKELKEHPHIIEELDTLVLFENYGSEDTMLLRGKAALRIAWYLGGWWRLFGFLSFLPALPFNLIYKIIAKNRYRLFKNLHEIPKRDFKDQFLP